MARCNGNYCATRPKRRARARYPQFGFAHAELPGLGGIAANTFDNVLCETVIMHLDRALVPPSVRRMLEIAKPGG